MTNLLSLLIVISAFLGLLVVVAYVADAMAHKFVEWFNLFIPNVEE